MQREVRQKINKTSQLYRIEENKNKRLCRTFKFKRIQMNWVYFCEMWTLCLVCPKNTLRRIFFFFSIYRNDLYAVHFRYELNTKHCRVSNLKTFPIMGIVNWINSNGKGLGERQLGTTVIPSTGIVESEQQAITTNHEQFPKLKESIFAFIHTHTRRE